jgi:hypothetical protein
VEPVTVAMVAGALAAGASAGLTSAASTAITDAYRSLRDAVQRRLGRGVKSLNDAEAGGPGAGG